MKTHCQKVWQIVICLISKAAISLSWLHSKPTLNPHHNIMWKLLRYVHARKWSNYHCQNVIFKNISGIKWRKISLKSAYEWLGKTSKRPPSLIRTSVRTNIRIDSNIKIFSSEYWYSYSIRDIFQSQILFEYLNIFVRIYPNIGL